ncbi:MAG: hypothetical protein ACFFCM_07500 [Promethearchaeota archaeon]
MEIKNFIPKIHKNGGNIYIEMLIEGEKCKICGKTMIKNSHIRPLFPNWMEINQEAQMKKSGLVFWSDTLVDDEYICVECEKAGKADFLCQLCKKRKPSNKVKESFGSPAEFLCTDCFETKTAKEWDKITDKLNEEHRYDFE